MSQSPKNHFILSKQRPEPTFVQEGFTLIEVLISLAIFTIIAIATVQQIRQIKETKDKALDQLESYDSVRAVLSLMRYDVSQAFHVRYDDIGKENKKRVLAGRPVAHTIFDGRKNELIFTTLSHRVFYAGLKECEQTEISYFLQKNQKGDTLSLVKRESPRIDDDLYEGGPVYRLLDNVEKLEFSYWDERQEKWVNDWNSDGQQYQDRFPLAIKVKITVAREDKEPMEVEANIKIAFPNNKKYVATF